MPVHQDSENLVGAAQDHDDRLWGEKCCFLNGQHPIEECLRVLQAPSRAGAASIRLRSRARAAFFMHEHGCARQCKDRVLPDRPRESRAVWTNAMIVPASRPDEIKSSIVSSHKSKAVGGQRSLTALQDAAPMRSATRERLRRALDDRPGSAHGTAYTQAAMASPRALDRSASSVIGSTTATSQAGETRCRFQSTAGLDQHTS